MSGWNKPTGKPVETKKAAKPAFKHVLIASGVVAVLGCVLLLVFGGGDGAPKAKAVKKAGVIKEVKPAPAPRAVESEEDVIGLYTNRNGKVIKRKKPTTYRDERGVLRYKGGARAPEKDEFKNPISVGASNNFPEFKHACENEIATLLTTEPGDMLCGEPNYDDYFKQDFIQALLEPVEISDDDTEKDKELKRLVEEQKHDLAKRIKNGEDLATIFTEARAEARRLAAVRKEIVEMAHSMVDDGDFSEQDMKDCYDAANKMLESKGLEPLKYEGIMKRRMALANRKAGMKNE